MGPAAGERRGPSSRTARRAEPACRGADESGARAASGGAGGTSCPPPRPVVAGAAVGRPVDGRCAGRDAPITERAGRLAEPWPRIEARRTPRRKQRRPSTALRTGCGQRYGTSSERPKNPPALRHPPPDIQVLTQPPQPAAVRHRLGPRRWRDHCCDRLGRRRYRDPRQAATSAGTGCDIGGAEPEDHREGGRRLLRRRRREVQQCWPCHRRHWSPVVVNLRGRAAVTSGRRVRAVCTSPTEGSGDRWPVTRSTPR